MVESHSRIRFSRASQEIEIEGSAAFVAEWWDRLSSELTAQTAHTEPRTVVGRHITDAPSRAEEYPEVFGEFYSSFRSGISEVDKVLIAAAFAQSKDSEKAFTTKIANQLLIEQNEKVANPSECVRRLVAMKRAFPIPPGRRFRVSASGFEYLKTLNSTD